MSEKEKLVLATPMVTDLHDIGGYRYQVLLSGIPVLVANVIGAALYGRKIEMHFQYTDDGLPCFVMPVQVAALDEEIQNVYLTQCAVALAGWRVISSAAENYLLDRQPDMEKERRVDHVEDAGLSVLPTSVSMEMFFEASLEELEGLAKLLRSDNYDEHIRVARAVEAALRS